MRVYAHTRNARIKNQNHVDDVDGMDGPLLFKRLQHSPTWTERWTEVDAGESPGVGRHDFVPEVVGNAVDPAEQDPRPV